MARQRSRPTWIQKVYQYGVMTNEPMSSGWWNEHKEMCGTWNKLVDKHAELLPIYNKIVLGTVELEELAAKIKNLNEQKKQIWADIKAQRIKDRSKNSVILTELSNTRTEINKELKEIYPIFKTKKAAFKEIQKPALSEYYEFATQEYNKIVNESTIYWANKQKIRDTFNAALKNPTVNRKSPHIKDIIFSHSYGGGGMTEKSLLNKNKRCYIEPINWDAVDTSLPQRQWKKLVRTKVHFFVNGEEKVFSCVFHRPLPKDCFIKQLTLSGRWIEKKIKWDLGITVEIPEEDMITVTNERICAAINTNWRITEEGLRIAAVIDEHGKSSIITLPQLEEKYRLPSNDIIKSVEYRKRLSTIMSEYINKLREYILTEKTNIPNVNQQLFVNIHIANRRRFFEFAKECKENDYPVHAEHLLNVLNEYKRALIRLKNHRQNVIRRRKQLYYDIAHSLCRKYNTIVMDNSNLKTMGMTTKRDENGLKYSDIAQKYKAEAAIGELRSIIKKVSKKYRNTCIIPQDPAWISMKHFNCGHTQSVSTDKLMVPCEKCGVTYDRDKNAALNIMAAFKKSIYINNPRP